jgi:hypothetical protein
MDTINQDLSSALPAALTLGNSSTTNPQPPVLFSAQFPGQWPAFVRSPAWNLVVVPLEHSPMEWATDVVYLLDLDGADMRNDYPGFGR